MTSLNESQTNTLRSLLKDGKKIEAIKEYRSYVQCDLKTAKDAVEALAESGNTERPVASSATHPHISEGQKKAIVAILRRGNKIEAIKEYRSYVRCDLKTAKDEVEALAEANGIELPSATGCGSAAALVLAAGITAIAAFEFFS